MKKATLVIALLLGLCVGSKAQSPTPLPPGPAAAPSPAPSMAPSPSPTPFLPVGAGVLQQPTTQTVTIYRKVSDTGILAASGAEIILPGVPTPLVRVVRSGIMQGQLDVTDTAYDGTVTRTSWDISALTSAQRTTTSSTQLAPDPLPKETFFINTTFSAGASATSNTSGTAAANLPITPVQLALGSVFVDDANRLFFTPPKAPIIMSIPAAVAEIDSVTHLANNGNLVAEWEKSGDTNYHVVTINSSSLTVTSDFMPEGIIGAQQQLTWVDGNDVLGRYNTHTNVEYTPVNLSQQSVGAKSTTALGQILLIQNGSIVTYTNPDY